MVWNCTATESKLGLSRNPLSIEGRNCGLRYHRDVKKVSEAVLVSLKVPTYLTLPDAHSGLRVCQDGVGCGGVVDMAGSASLELRVVLRCALEPAVHSPQKAAFRNIVDLKLQSDGLSGPRDRP